MASQKPTGFQDRPNTGFQGRLPAKRSTKHPGKPQVRLRVKNEPPTMEEALIAAECISTDLDEQITIAATLLGLEPTAEATIKALKAARPRGKTVEVIGRGRTASRSVVVVERKSRARIGAPRPVSRIAPVGR